MLFKEIEKRFPYPRTIFFSGYPTIINFELGFIKLLLLFLLWFLFTPCQICYNCLSICSNTDNIFAPDIGILWHLYARISILLVVLSVVYYCKLVSWHLYSCLVTWIFCLLIHNLILIQICDFGLAKWLPTQWTHHNVSKFEGTFGCVRVKYFGQELIKVLMTWFYFCFSLAATLHPNTICMA